MDPGGGREPSADPGVSPVSPSEAAEEQANFDMTQRLPPPRHAFQAFLALSLVFGCAEDTPTGPEPPDITTLEFAPELGIDLAQMTLTPTGLYYQDLVVGEGLRVGVSEGAQFSYQGWLHDGTDIETGVYPTGPFSPGAIQGADGEWYYLVGSGNTLSGWDLGLDGMRPGGIRKVIIPPHLGFGAAGSPDGRVPGNAVMVYVLEVLAVEP